MEQALSLSRKAAEVFRERGIENGRLDAELLLANVLAIDRLKLYLQHDRPVTPAELERFRDHVKRRLKREPVQYIIGVVGFRDITLKVDRRALIPRPETEVLVGTVLAWLKEHAEGPASVLDIGTGTGAIALSLASEATDCTTVATDVSAEALALAAENTAMLGLGARVALRQGDLWEAVWPGERFDVIVSNPPYVAESERADLAPEVASWEPEAALFAQEAGLAVLSAIIRRAHEYLRARGLLALEIGAGQAVAVSALLSEAGHYTTPRVIRDLAGRDRIIVTEVERVEA
ncbi:MAG: peptide chain release factor N(5)-glutamine methyltransferase [Longimicrobiales bacterium]